MKKSLGTNICLAGMTFKKGTVVVVPIYALHRQEEYFGKRVEEFDPDRFLTGEADSSSPAYHCFGYGPRQCLGSRFISVTLRMIMAKILFNYEILTKDRLELSKGCPFFLNFKKFKVTLRKRVS